MGEQLAGWAAFVGAIITIFLEIRRHRRNDQPDASNIQRVLLSGLGIVILSLSAVALNAVAAAFRLDADYLNDCFGDTCFGTTLDQLNVEKLELAISVVETVTVAVWAIAAVVALVAVVDLVKLLRQWKRTRPRQTARPHVLEGAPSAERTATHSRTKLKAEGLRRDRRSL
ncbi:MULTISPECIES: hypothetical protein [unclassified Microbacterium]|uniref:hypothetical protein n=1 Tax=unclassified Microbacterium TaxID=2609290 RepID=UPI003867BF60